MWYSVSMKNVVSLLDGAAAVAVAATLVLVVFPDSAPALPWLKALPATLWAVSLAVVRAPGWPLMVPALALSAVADGLLATGTQFVAGAAVFAVVQILYSVRFWGLALRRGLHRGTWLGPLVYGTALAVLLAATGGHLGPLAPAMAAYGLLVTVAASGATAAGRGWVLILGTGLFFFSDAAILCLRVWPLAAPASEWLILVPYWAGQYLIVRDQRR